MTGDFKIEMNPPNYEASIKLGLLHPVERKASGAVPAKPSPPDDQAMVLPQLGFRRLKPAFLAF
jgi:hypothetical protein